MTLDQLPRRQRARITHIDWSRLAEDEARRLRALGVAPEAEVAVAHRGVMGSHDPLAIAIGGVVIALRRSHCAAISVEPLEADA